MTQPQNIWKVMNMDKFLETEIIWHQHNNFNFREYVILRMFFLQPPEYFGFTNIS
jgi:hypothetical protein